MITMQDETKKLLVLKSILFFNCFCLPHFSSSANQCNPHKSQQSVHWRIISSIHLPSTVNKITRINNKQISYLLILRSANTRLYTYIYFTFIVCYSDQITYCMNITCFLWLVLICSRLTHIQSKESFIFTVSFCCKHSD